LTIAINKLGAFNLMKEGCLHYWINLHFGEVRSSLSCFGYPLLW